MNILNKIFGVQSMRKELSGEINFESCVAGTPLSQYLSLYSPDIRSANQDVPFSHKTRSLITVFTTACNVSLS